MAGVKLREEWLSLIGEECEGEYLRSLGDFLRAEKAAGKKIYPPGDKIFNALELTPPNAIKAVILGQDPYHGTGQAHGLCFSVQSGVKTPPSLRNIFLELNRDLRVDPPASGDLTAWAERGVLLLNTVLTVEEGLAGSHQNKGWERLTDKIIEVVAGQPQVIVFLLWGAKAAAKIPLIESAGKGRHCILTAPHPSPLSAHRGFIGCGHFGQANAFLVRNGVEPIDWSLT